MARVVQLYLGMKTVKLTTNVIKALKTKVVRVTWITLKDAEQLMSKGFTVIITKGVIQ